MTIAILDSVLPHQLAERPRDLEGLEVVVRAPVSLTELRSHMMGVLVRSILAAKDGDAPRAPSAPRGTMNKPTPRAFSIPQLGRLAEIKSAIDCECPNHLSTLLLQLNAFEDYSARCTNKNDADAAVHRALYEHTAQARAIMEQALEILVRHEKIVL